MKRSRNSLVPYLSIALIASIGAALALARLQRLRQSPRQAGIAFATALESNDVAGADARAVGTDAQFAFIGAMSQWTVAYGNYESAFAVKFSAGQKPFLENSHKMVQQLETADQKIDGDTATLATQAAGSQVLKFQRSHGQWKLDLSSLCSESDAAGEIKKLHGLANAYDASRKELETGKIATAEKARADLKRRVDGILFIGYRRESQTPPIGSPTTRPLPTTQLTTRPVTHESE